ncbi:MAG: tRNA (adenosine(37)-N6)-dimethylallyltransferase MiaA [Clostridiales bacterium]|nr:tRNA (adenosine(37)-N6)-dimethylallyltransferase MiaA [Clostridiales bacterium]
MVQAHRIKTIAIVGCTAIGKSDTALKLAREFNGVLVGADSMQIYRNFDIGTGKLTKEECGDVEHRLIDVVDGDADFSVGEYVELAKKEIADISQNSRLPIVVGGTGLYVYSLFSGCDFGSAPKDEHTRKMLKLSSHFFSAIVMHGLLENVDKASAQKISANDNKRVVRALEIYALCGAPKSQAVGTNKPYDDLTIVLTLPREMLYDRINRRVKKMFDDGLIEEATGLIKYRDCGSMQALGYKQIAANPYASREELEQLVAQKTRNYAKRQITYFKNVGLNKVFIDARDYEAIKNCVTDFLRK